jgi:hypothetical protein
MFVMQAWRKDLLAKNEKEGKETSTVKFGMYTHESIEIELTKQLVTTLVLSVLLPASSLTLMISLVDPDSSGVLSSLTTERLSVSLSRRPHQRVSVSIFRPGASLIAVTVSSAEQVLTTV